MATLQEVSKRFDKVIRGLGAGISVKDERELKEIAADVAALAAGQSSAGEAPPAARVRKAAQRPAKAAAPAKSKKTAKAK